MSTKKLRALHVGAGTQYSAQICTEFKNYEEVRLDIDSETEPDICADMRDLHMVEDNSFDGVYSSHNLEHILPSEVIPTLKEWLRVLKPGCALMIAVPDLQAAAELIAIDELEVMAYQAPGGAIRPLDVLYGLESVIAEGNEFMCHKTGFTATTLTQKLTKAGFERAKVMRMDCMNLWGAGFKPIDKA